MKNTNGVLTLLVLFTFLCGILFAPIKSISVKAQENSTIQFFVAKDGKDTNDGSINNPFATLERAREAVRELKSSGGIPAGGVTITIRKGEYRFTSTFDLDDRDSGTADSPIVYKAYDGESVSFVGGDTLDASLFKPVKDAVVLARLPQEAGSKVLQVDLKALGVSDYGILGNNLAVAPELFFNGSVMTLARWPNNGFTTVSQVVYSPDAVNPGYTFTYKDDGLQRWANSDYTWMLGYWGNDWATNDLQIKSINFDQKKIETYTGTSYAMKADQRFYFYNILEELDTPGEWYIDRGTGMLYLYPPAPIQDKKVQLSLFNRNLISMNKASNIVFAGINMEVNRGNAIDIIDGENNLVKNCEISKMGGYAVKINGGKNNGVYGCRIYSMGNGGVYLNGGDFTTLTPAGNYADNNDIYNYARIKLTYTSAVELNGVGNRASHNKMHNAPHLAIQFRGNDHIMEYNEIYDVVKETADASAIYSGRSFVWRGNVIRYNYFHDIIASDLRVSTAAIYLDDYMSGVEMRGNVFYKIGKQAFKLANGRENIVENNIMIDCGTSIAFMTRDYKPGEKNYESLMSKFNQVPYQSEIWSQRYPTLPNILNDDPLLPKRNVVRNNVICSSGSISGDYQRNRDLGTFENNLTYSNKDALGFVDAANGNFELRDDSIIFTQIPGFQKIPFSKIGPLEGGIPPASAELGASSLIYAQNSGDSTIRMYLNGNKLISIKDETGVLVEGTDFTNNTSSVTFKKEYLSKLPQGQHPLTFTFSAGYDALLSINVVPPASSELSTPSITYPQNSGDSTIQMKLNGNTLVSIKDSTNVLTEGTDYINNGASVTLKKGYLEKLPLGQYTLTFTFSAGSDAVLTINVARVSLTVGKTYTASSTWSSSYDAAKAFDSKSSTRWSAASGKVTNQYLTVDFGADTQYNQVIISEINYPRVNSYVLQYSEDGINYIDIPGTAGTSIGASKTINFVPVTSQYLRLWMYSTKKESTTYKEPTINEIEVYYEEPPLLVVPKDMTVEAIGERTPVNIGMATSTPGVSITNDAPADFPLGTTVVTWTAKKQNGIFTTGTQTVTVADTTPPTITGAVTTQPNANQWYNNDVTVHFTAVDSGSGVKSVTSDITLTTEGVSQSVYGTAADNAGSMASFTVGNINIDKTKPGISIAAAAAYKTSDSLTVTYAVYDNLSGVESATATLNGKPVTNGQVINLAAMAGSNTLIVTAKDKADNASVKSVTFEVVIDTVVDIHPETLELKSNGGANSMTVYMELPSGYDGSSIDLSSVKMVVNGVVIQAQLSPSEIGDYDGDRVKDLMVKFDRQKVITAIGDKTGAISILINGSLKGGNNFSGSDVVKVIQ